MRVHATAWLVVVTSVLTGLLMLPPIAAFGEIARPDGELSGAERADRAISELRALVTDDFAVGELTSRRTMAAAARHAVDEHGIRSIEVSVVNSLVPSGRRTTVRVRADQATADAAQDGASVAVVAPGTPAAPEQLLESAALITTPLGHDVRIAASFLAVGHADGGAGRLHALALLGAVIGILGVPYVVVARLASQRARRQLREREAEIARIRSAALDERRRIAAAVHDGALQDLLGVSLGLANAARVSATADGQMLREMSGVTRRTVQSLRSVLADVYPADVPTEGWTAGLESVVSDLRSAGVEVTIDVEDVALCAAEEASVLRVAREALRNVYKHAAASSVSVRFRARPEGDELLIVDDGIGFDSRAATSARRRGHLGLRLLRDAARDADAGLSIDSAPGLGTTVRLEFQRLAA